MTNTYSFSAFPKPCANSITQNINRESRRWPDSKWRPR